MSHNTQQANPFLIDNLPLNNVSLIRKHPLKWVVENFLGLRHLAQAYQAIDSQDPADFAAASLQKLGIDYNISDDDLARIPREGPTVIVANHPCGAVEGLILINMLLLIRDDVRIMANNMLSSIPEITDCFIPVNPYNTSNATLENMAPLRQAIKWLRQGGMVVVFPAGDVSSFQFKKLTVMDGAWNDSIARLILHTSATTLPVHFQARNSALFYGLGAIHPILKTALLPRQLLNKSGSTIAIKTGKAIDISRLQKFATHSEIMNYLRLKTYMLGDLGSIKKKLRAKSGTSPEETLPVIDTVNPDLLSAEINNLPAEQLLVDSSDMVVFHASAQQIPWTLRELGRLREITFRQAGEGTGRELDIDEYDAFYTHLFIWHKSDQGIVGAYRFCQVNQITDKYGLAGLYTHSLFKYNRAFLRELGNAMELGRSFIQPDYQRSFSPLLLLWKGICQYVARHPDCTTLFGPVSISNDYNMLSKQLLVNFLRQNSFDKKRSRMVRPRNPYRGRSTPSVRQLQLNGFTVFDELSEFVNDIEDNNRGVPILIKQYLKWGGRLLGFNVDPDFKDCVDGLIVVDFLDTDENVLSRYMGKSASRQYLDYHKHSGQRVA